MESEMPSFSDNQQRIEDELPLPEAIAALMQEEVEALKQVEMVSIRLFKALEQQMGEAENLIAHIKR